jgi:hypothetical protein
VLYVFNCFCLSNLCFVPEIKNGSLYLCPRFFVLVSVLVCGVQLLNTEVTCTVQLHDIAILPGLMWSADRD